MRNGSADGTNIGSAAFPEESIFPDGRRISTGDVLEAVLTTLMAHAAKLCELQNCASALTGLVLQ